MPWLKHKKSTGRDQLKSLGYQPERPDMSGEDPRTGEPKPAVVPYTHQERASVVAWFVVAGLLAILIVWGAYGYAFRHVSYEASAASWGQFGDFLGGALNPILSFLTLVMLAMTLALQGRQLEKSTEELELSRDELRLTRVEIERSAHSQEQAEIALRAQADNSAQSARLASMNALYAHYQEELTALKRVNHPAGSLKAERLALVRQRIKRLNAEFDHLFAEFVEP